MKIITCVAPVNIAVIKYWGKRDENLILPLNDSISATLSLDYMCAKTTIMASPLFKENKFWLNGKEDSFDNPRLQNCLVELRHRAELCGDSDTLKYNLHICSENNFPTAAGLASSAAGYACVVSALAALYNVTGDISSVARRGSGSACRSVFGGWVHWHKGNLSDGSDSLATQIVPATHWPEMRILVLVVNDARKKFSSTSAMKRSVHTSELLKHRVEHIVPKRTAAIVQAIKDRNFQVFADLTMQDSNQFHAICLDTYPPCTYMNDVSHAIVDMVHMYNNIHGSNKIAYTFDAGPNACLYLLEENVPHTLAMLNAVFPSSDNSVEYVRGSPVNEVPLPGNLELLNLTKHKPGMLKYIIHTKVGDGPKILKDFDCHLLNEAGLPKFTM
ncbi:Mevalonate diphosphate decarboxylase [Carabus blaptoides fortunei]